MSREQINLDGVRVGRLTVIRKLAPIRKGPGRGFRQRWECRCDCGGLATVWQDSLRSARTQSCGCLQRERARLSGLSRRSHGESRHAANTVEYRIWHGMVQRCHNETDKAYKWYGGRGITVCERWRNSFENFIGDLLGTIGRRSPGPYSLDRIQNNQGYSPENIRWATKKEQVRNSRAIRPISFNGKTLCMAEWAELTGIPRSAICNRLRDGWSIERALQQNYRVTRRRK